MYNIESDFIKKGLRAVDFKEVIANAVSKVTNIDKDEIKGFIEIPKEETNGDYSFPCFRLAKELHQSPINIANNIKENIDIDQKSCNGCRQTIHQIAPEKAAESTACHT